MPELFGKPIKPEDLARRVGRIDQVAGARPYVFDDGPARGMRGIDVWTGSGLTFTVLPDRCLDIGSARFNGRALAWESSTGPVAPERFDPQGFGWLKSFHGGLLTTCGLRHFGAPDADENGESWGLHGRASHLSAEEVAVHGAWEKDQYRLRIRGRVVEAQVFKPTILLERTIVTALGSRLIEVIDRLSNIGHEPSTAMLLYHVNLGWPLLSQESRLAVNAKSVKGVTDRANAHLAEHAEMLPPTAGFEEHTYSIEPKAGADGLCRAALVNPDLDGGTALSVTWPKATMPFMAEWKMMGQGTYVLGIEPCNCPFPPRADLRRRGLMPMLSPGESFEAGLAIRIHRGADEIKEIERAIRKAR
jgi:hypothetical protein